MASALAYPLLRAPFADGRVETAGAVSHSRAGLGLLLSHRNVRALTGTDTARGSKHMSRYQKGHFLNLTEHIPAAYPQHAAKHLARELAVPVRTAKRYAAGSVPQRLAARLATHLLHVIARRESHLRRLRLDLERALHGESAEISRRRVAGAADRRRARGAAAVARGLSAVPADRTGETEVTE